MNNEVIKEIRSGCEYLEQVAANNVDGEGSSLYDIKNTFDYVINTMQNQELVGTTFGDDVVSKAKTCANLLSELATNINNLSKAVNAFCDAQEFNNSLGL